MKQQTQPRIQDWTVKGIVADFPRPKTAQQSEAPAQKPQGKNLRAGMFGGKTVAAEAGGVSPNATPSPNAP